MLCYRKQVYGLRKRTGKCPGEEMSKGEMFRVETSSAKVSVFLLSHAAY